MIHNLSRLRRNTRLRQLVGETEFVPGNLVLPCFVCGGKGKRDPIASLPGLYRFSPDRLAQDVAGLLKSGVFTVMLFGVPEDKDHLGSGAFQDDGVVQSAVRALRERFGAEIVIITDVCLCAYTPAGHCGITRKRGLDRPATLQTMSRMAVSHARSGADIVAPSAMADGQVAALRTALDEEGFDQAAILSYSAKYASSFYGPFREAVDAAPAFGDRAHYQMDYRNSREALAEVEQDIREGADLVMVKPALAYLDVICRVRAACSVPVAAYSVSGEYKMLKDYGAGDAGRERAAVLETLTAIKRAGADIIITYYAQQAAEWMHGKREKSAPGG